MKTPPFLMGVSLIFWGWQTGYLTWAVPMAVVLEGSRWVPYRWDWTPRDFYRLSDLSALLLMVMVVFRFAAGTESMARWLPMGLFPLIFGQCSGRVGGVDRGALFYSARRKEKAGRHAARRTVDISYPYLACVVLSASAANQRTPVFFTATALLAGWALWHRRPRFTRWSFVALFLAAATAGYGASIGLHQLQVWLETGFIEWMTDRGRSVRSPSRSRTAIGEIGKLKQFERIVLRVRPVGSFRAGQLLHEASFNRYRNGLWVAGRAAFEALPSEGPEGSGVWRLADTPADGGFTLDVTLRLEDGAGVLSLPHGSYRIESLPAGRLERSPYGAFRVGAASPLATYRVHFHSGVRLQSEPGPADRELPDAERAAVVAQLEALGVGAASPGDRVSAIESFFQTRFTYSLEQGPAAPGSTPLAHFLSRSRSGHCEFFATATVLMLRGAGIPARYATGYAVSEYSGLEKAFVVRSRHAHAWALAYLDGLWVPVDTTPGTWVQMERQRSGMLTPVVDVFRWAGHHFALLRRDVRLDGTLPWVAVVLLPAAGFALVRLLHRRKALRKPAAPIDREARAGPPLLDSPFTAVQARLVGAGYRKHPWEPPQEWIERLARSGFDPAWAGELREVVRLHYRLRFHPGGLSENQRVRMRERCSALGEAIGTGRPG